MSGDVEIRRPKSGGRGKTAFQGPGSRVDGISDCGIQNAPGFRDADFESQTVLVLRNRQRTLRLDLRFLRRVTRHLLESELRLAAYQLGIHFVSATRMAEVNSQYLAHEGPTDVITFNHAAGLGIPPAGGPARPKPELPTPHGELFICPAVAQAQAPVFGTTGRSEVVRYVVHGVLHLRGFDDRTPARRRAMKREENRLLRRLARRFNLSRARTAPTVRA